MPGPIRSAAIACLMLAPALLAAQPPKADSKADPKGVEGLWEGTLKAGAIEVRLGFKVARDKDGKLTATLNSPDQGAKDIPLPDVAFADAKLTLGLPDAKLKVTLTLSDDGTKLKGDFEQGSEKFPFEMKRVEALSTVNRPQHPKKPYPYVEEEVTFENAGAKIKLAGTLTLPKGNGPFTAVVMVTGSGPQDRDESLLGHKPFLVIADHLTRQGFAVLRYDDRGVAKSGGKFAGATSTDFATDAHAAVAYLKTRKEIDPKRIGIVGHSEGGLIAPMVASDHPSDVGFIVLLAGPGLSGAEVIKGQAEAILKAGGGKEDEIKLQLRIQQALVETLTLPGEADKLKERMRAAAKALVDGLTPEEKKALKIEKEGAKELDAAIERLADPWMVFFIAHDPRPALAKVKCPVLAVNGELDLQVLHAENLAEIEKALKKGGNMNFTIKVFPKLNHLFQHTKTGSPSEYGKIEETFAPEALEFVTDWLKKLK